MHDFCSHGRKCIWERVYFLFKGKSDQAFRRKSLQPVGVEIGDVSQKVWYYSPGELADLFKSEFYLVRKNQLASFLPSSYLESGMRGKNILKKILRSFENVFGNFSFLSDYADHFLIEFRKH